MSSDESSAPSSSSSSDERIIVYAPRYKHAGDLPRKIHSAKLDDPPSASTCHWCRHKTVEDKVRCCRCPIRFCGSCLSTRHGEILEEQMEEGVRWVCPSCRGGCGRGCYQSCCNCGRCRKARGLSPTTLKNGFLKAGCNNAHDYLIFLETGESVRDIASRKLGKNWIKERSTISYDTRPLVKRKILSEIDESDHIPKKQIICASNTPRSLMLNAAQRESEKKNYGKDTRSEGRRHFGVKAEKMDWNEHEAATKQMQGRGEVIDGNNRNKVEQSKGGRETSVRVKVEKMDPAFVFVARGDDAVRFGKSPVEKQQMATTSKMDSQTLGLRRDLNGSYPQKMGRKSEVAHPENKLQLVAMTVKKDKYDGNQETTKDIDPREFGSRRKGCPGSQVEAQLVTVKMEKHDDDQVMRDTQMFGRKRTSVGKERMPETPGRIETERRHSDDDDDDEDDEEEKEEEEENLNDGHEEGEEHDSSDMDNVEPGIVSDFSHLLESNAAGYCPEQGRKASENGRKFRDAVKRNRRKYCSYVHLLSKPARGVNVKQEKFNSDSEGGSKPTQRSSLTDQDSDSDTGTMGEGFVPGQDGRNFLEQLEKELAKPFDKTQLVSMMNQASCRKPVLRYRDTRRGSMSVETDAEAPSYLDHHPDLAAKIETAKSDVEKLCLLRGFFFWLVKVCDPGAFKPWVTKPSEESNDCYVDNPDCAITAVVAPLNAAKNQQKNQMIVKVKEEKFSD